MDYPGRRIAPGPASSRLTLGRRPVKLRVTVGSPHLRPNAALKLGSKLFFQTVTKASVILTLTRRWLPCSVLDPLNSLSSR